MILIDAEKLEDALDWIIDPCVRHDAVDTIREQEEVDAVPVKFIIEYLNKGGKDKISECLKEWEEMTGKDIAMEIFERWNIK